MRYFTVSTSCIFLLIFAVESVQNNCNKNGILTKFNVCECFKGFIGSSCSQRSCPLGPQLAGIAYGTDLLHGTESMCSGKGECDFSTGNCKCFDGFTGSNCGRMSCFNDCSDRGECVSLRVAATENNAFQFNRTTVYSQWDADLFRGCKCFPGFSGADCSLRECAYGVDPRKSSQSLEVISLVCDCTPHCSGKFKLRMLGIAVPKFFDTTSTDSDVAAQLAIVMKTNSYDSVITVKSTQGTICKIGSTTTTTFTFRKTTANIPTISFYANLIVGGSLHFRTIQTLQCDCTPKALAVGSSCNGSFRLSFDGESSDKLYSLRNNNNIILALQRMNTIKAGVIQVIGNGASSLPVCVAGLKNTYSIVFQSQFGNVPQLQLWSSVGQGSGSLSYFNAANATAVLSFKGVGDDNVKLCNGIGKCDFTTSTCLCPFGWKQDKDLGPCGQLFVNSSTYSGLSRCPGIVAPGDPTDLSSKQNYYRLYLSLNPTLKGNSNRSVIMYYPYDRGSNFGSVGLNGPLIRPTNGIVYIFLTSNTSAGPIVIDSAKQQMFFIDLNPKNSFIGLAPLAQTQTNPTTVSYTVWFHLNVTVFGFTGDLKFGRRRLYWTTPGKYLKSDGNIYYADMDQILPVKAYSLKAAIGFNNVIDPMGIAIHFYEKKIYWLDKNISINSHPGHLTCLRSCNLDGSEYSQVFLYRIVDNVTTSINATDLVIDFFHNNTALFVDYNTGYHNNTVFPAAIVATNLDAPNIFNKTGAGDRFKNMEETHIILQTISYVSGTAEYLAIDTDTTTLLWSVPSSFKVIFNRYVDQSNDLFPSGIAYDNAKDGFGPVGLAFDLGLGPPHFAHKECYGNGRCSGFTNNFACECDSGFYGDCQARTCTSGNAWWHEPIVDEIAHDEQLECSNMGLCQRQTGQCSCRPGFEGAACERMSCQKVSSKICSGNGRCLSSRELATKRVDKFLNPAPVVYGSVPNNPYTWDADMIFTCFGDIYGYSPTGNANISTYLGDRCDQHQCPIGYDTRLANNLYNHNTLGNYTIQKEVQQLQCSATGGFFSLEFRGSKSSKIQSNTTITDLLIIFQGISTLGEVALNLEVVGPSGSNTVCSTSNNYNKIDITFLSQFINTPLLIITNNNLIGSSHLSVVRTTTGSGPPPSECVGRGECDRGSGECVCSPHYGSSDGFGERGLHGDCGYSLIK